MLYTVLYKREEAYGNIIYTLVARNEYGIIKIDTDSLTVISKTGKLSNGANLADKIDLNYKSSISDIYTQTKLNTVAITAIITDGESVVGYELINCALYVQMVKAKFMMDIFPKLNVLNAKLNNNIMEISKDIITIDIHKYSRNVKIIKQGTEYYCGDYIYTLGMRPGFSGFDGKLRIKDNYINDELNPDSWSVIINPKCKDYNCSVPLKEIYGLPVKVFENTFAGRYIKHLVFPIVPNKDLEVSYALYGVTFEILDLRYATPKQAYKIVTNCCEEHIMLKNKILILTEEARTLIYDKLFSLDPMYLAEVCKYIQLDDEIIVNNNQEANRILLKNQLFKRGSLIITIKQSNNE